MAKKTEANSQEPNEILFYEAGEISRVSTTKNFLVVQKEGTRIVQREVAFYNLEAIIAVGYRVNSEQGIAFRRWATDKLISMLLLWTIVRILRWPETFLQQCRINWHKEKNRGLFRSL